MTRDRPEAIPAVRYAALSGLFHPAAALNLVVTDDRIELERVAARLGGLCDTAPTSDGRWLMRPVPRSTVIRSLIADGLLDEAIAERKGWPTFDGDAQALTELLNDAASPLQSLTKTGLLDTLTNFWTRPQPSDLVSAERLWHLLQMAAPVVGDATVLATRALLDRRTGQLRAKALLGRGFEGRDSEITQLRAWINAPQRRSPVTALYVQGLPAIGKSTLLEQAIAKHEGTAERVVIRMDFDRSGLDPRDPLRLSVELARQIAAWRPDQAEHLEGASLKAIGDVASDGRRFRETLPRRLAATIGAAVPDDVPLVFILDTLEALDARGPRQVEQLFMWLDQIVDAVGQPVAILAGGRGDGRQLLGSRLADQPIILEGLSRQEEVRLMDRLEIPDNLRDRVAKIAGGNPLRLRLAGRLASNDPGAFKVAGSTDAAHLYRTLQSRIADPVVRSLLAPGLLMRRLDRESFKGVIAPFFKLELTLIELDHLFNELVAQTWLFEPDPRQDGWFKQPPHIRTLVANLMPLHAETKRFHRSAARWLAKRPTVLEQADGLFHRLSAESIPPATSISPELAAQFDENMLMELTEEARRAVLWARGDLSSRYDRVGRLGSSPSESDARNLAISLERGDPEESEYLHRETFEGRYIRPDSFEADVHRAFLWRSGRWQAAFKNLRERDRIRGGDEDLPALLETLPADVAFSRIEMRAEMSPRDLQRNLKRADRDFIFEVRRLYERDTRSRLKGAAADFLVRDVEIRASPDRHGEVIDMTFAIWMDGLWDRVAGDLAVSLNDNPFTRTAHERARVCRGLFRYNPIAEPVVRLLGKAGVDQAVESMSPDLWRFLQREAGVASPDTSPSYGRLVETGWFAEWLSMEAFRRRNPDLSVLSRRSEAWRQTVGGRWRYGRPPRRWSEDLHGVDLVTEARILRLLEAQSPEADAYAHIHMWHPSPAKTRLERYVYTARVRLSPPALEKAGHPALAAARQLHELGAPSALVPALAILAIA